MEYPSGNAGKGFEYLSAKAIVDAGLGFLDSKSQAKQSIDRGAFENLKLSQRQYLVSASSALCDWLVDNSVPYSEVSRPDDATGEAGEPGDIVLTHSSSRLSISLKHDNDAIKHHRPSNFAGQCGFLAGSPQETEWRELYGSSVTRLLRTQHSDSDDVAAADLDRGALYDLVTDLATSQLNRWMAHNPSVAGTLYEFLVGPTDLVTALATPKHLKISRWAFDRNPSGLAVSKVGDTLVLEFSNGHAFTWRIHTASSEIKIVSPSMKWDVRSVQDPELIFRKIFDRR